ncbi:hypothetical protein Avbf_18666 [Armadillidium vulgare]|nr:hypothetical protein Avbf_18666 [Armadillidium vulgare]
MIIMIICPASFFRCQRTKNSLFNNSKIFNFVIDYVQRSLLEMYALTANSTTPSDFPDSRDSYDHNDYMPSLIFLVIYSKRTAFTANSTTPSDSPDSRDSYDHNDYMPSLIFLGVIYSKCTALTANSTTTSDFPDSKIHNDHNDYMPSLIF